MHKIKQKTDALSNKNLEFQRKPQSRDWNRIRDSSNEGRPVIRQMRAIPRISRKYWLETKIKSTKRGRYKALCWRWGSALDRGTQLFTREVDSDEDLEDFSPLSELEVDMLLSPLGF